MTALYCIIFVLVGTAAGVGIGYFIWGKTNQISKFPVKDESPARQNKEFKQNADLPSKEMVLKALELLECIYEINHTE